MRSNVLRLDPQRIKVAARPVPAAPHVPTNRIEALSQRFDINAVTQPRLTAAVAAWAEIAPGGAFQFGKGRSAHLIRDDLLGDRSTMVIMDEADPMNWIIGFYGNGFGVYESRNFLARRVGDMPDPGICQATISGYMEALPEARPAVHRITGEIMGRPVGYDRLILPLVDDQGQAVRFITISEMLFGGRD